LSNTFASILMGREIKKALIGLSGLHDQLRLSVHRKDQRALGLLQLSGEGR